jgi:hypothetical protein
MSPQQGYYATADTTGYGTTPDPNQHNAPTQYAGQAPTQYDPSAYGQTAPQQDPYAANPYAAPQQQNPYVADTRNAATYGAPEQAPWGQPAPQETMPPVDYGQPGTAQDPYQQQPSTNYQSAPTYQPGNNGYNPGQTGYEPAGAPAYQSPAPAYGAPTTQPAGSPYATPTYDASQGTPQYQAPAPMQNRSPRYRPGGTSDYMPTRGAQMTQPTTSAVSPVTYEAPAGAFAPPAENAVPQ